MRHTIWAVAGFEYEQACQIFAEIESMYGQEIAWRIKKIESAPITGLTTLFMNGVMLIWIRPYAQVCGFRFDRLWCNKDINQTHFNSVIMKRYCGKQEDIIWL